MNVYRDMLNIIIRRQFALLGRYQTKEILKEAGIIIDERGNLESPQDIEEKHIDKILSEFKNKIGFISLLVVKLPLRRLAIQNNVKVPRALL